MIRGTLLAILLLICGAVSAADESPWRLGAAFGYGERTNPIVFADDVPIVVDLDIAWFGERWFFDNGDLGFTFVNDAAVTANIMARVKSDRVFFGLTNTRFVSVALDGLALSAEAQVEVPDRDYAIEAGIELLSDGRWGFVQLSAFHDVSGTHDGFEVDASYGMGFRLQRLYIEPSVGVAYKSDKLNDYYWGIRPSESNSATPVYVADSGINTRARIRASYHFNSNWAITASAEYERIPSTISDSPIVIEDNVVGWFFGAAWQF